MRLLARMQKKQWVITPPDDRAEQLAKSLRVSPLPAQVLINRQIYDADAAGSFLKSKLTDLIVPEQMPGVEKAVERIKSAILNNEKITIYGDYDVDGITAISILWQILMLLEADVDYYIPHRVDEGYGLNENAVEELAKAGTKLLITVDCGINAIKSAETAARLGLDLIITDHHQTDLQLPQAVAIVHPAMDKSYPNQNSCGAMVAYKLAWAIANEFNSATKLDPTFREFMIDATSLAAIGTIADVMDMRGENRILTSFGLKSLPHCKLCGIQALIEIANLTGQGLDSYHIGFRLAPMLNAAGRMGHARLAVELLTSNSRLKSIQIAEYLKEQNTQRQSCERKILKQACEMVTQQGLNHPDRKSIVLAAENWHVGVIGIVASRIVDKFSRPTIIFNTSDAIGQASARSIAGFDLLAAISACSRHLISFGGHKMAAGIKIKTETIADFADDIENYAKENLNEEDIIAKLNIDAEAQLAQLNKNTVTTLESFGPFGQGNPEPVFATKGVRLAAGPRRVGAKGAHLQLAVTDSTASIRCIGFGMGKHEKKLLEHEFFNVAYKPQINHFNGNSSVQLCLEDIQFE